MKAFKAYDIRGVYGADFDRDAVYRIGFFLPRLFGAGTIAVGCDARLSSPEISQTLLQGITDSGADVDFFGLSSTPFMYWVTARQGYETSVMITASHNPKNHNGLKISAKNAAPVGYDNGLNKLEHWVETETPQPAPQKGTVKNMEGMLTNDYLAFQRRYLGNLDGLRMVVDCSNGMANLFVKDILPDNTTFIADTIDGNFPCHEPNPLEPANIVALQQKVIEENADIGVIYDGDADRVMFVDENADFVSPDLMIGLLATHFLKNDGCRHKVLQDIRTSKAVAELIAELGGEPYIWRVGRAYAATKLREIDGLFGGELAGHYYFRDFYYSDSGIMASLLILTIIAEQKRKGKTFSQVMAGIARYKNSGEINFTIDKKQEAMDLVKNHFCNIEKPTRFLDFDGYRVEYPHWWFNIRPSNTEPYLRLILEADTDELLTQKTDEIKQLLNPFICK
ncbi:MAG: phosphomannomutase/phosphoglucomutase [Bacteroidales bacterium]|nr:phosphomannomutase/phosphoglucomutase [Bacteroidales bacterium]